MQSPAAEPRIQTFEAAGLEMHYVEYGAPTPDAPPLLLLHGLTSSWRAWQRVAERWVDRYRVIGLDQRGHGDSSWANQEHYATADYVTDIDALIDHLGLDRVILVGQSMGGHNTIAYAARRPERVICAVANDIPWRVERSRDPADYAEQFPGGQHRVYATLDEWIAERREASPLTPQWAHELNAEAQLRPVDGGYLPRHDPQASIHWQPADLREEAASITTPLLLVRGGRSHLLDAQTLQDMTMAIPGARSVTLEQAGHSTFHDMFDEWVTVVSDFLAAHMDR